MFIFLCHFCCFKEVDLIISWCKTECSVCCGWIVFTVKWQRLKSFSIYFFTEKTSWPCTHTSHFLNIKKKLVNNACWQYSVWYKHTLAYIFYKPKIFHFLMGFSYADFSSETSHSLRCTVTVNHASWSVPPSLFTCVSGWRRSLWLRTAVPVKTTWLRPWSTTCCRPTRELWWRPPAHAWGLQPAVLRY